MELLTNKSGLLVQEGLRAFYESTGRLAEGDRSVYAVTVCSHCMQSIYAVNICSHCMQSLYAQSLYAVAYAEGCGVFSESTGELPQGLIKIAFPAPLMSPGDRSTRSSHEF